MSRFVRYHLPTLLWAVAMIVATSLPSLSTPSLPMLPAQDKLFHFFEYSVLGFLVVRSAVAMGLSLSTRTLVRVGGGGVLFALLDELHQLPLPGRDASPYDFLADAAGIVVGIYLYRLLRRRYMRLDMNQQRGG